MTLARRRKRTENIQKEPVRRPPKPGICNFLAVFITAHPVSLHHWLYIIVTAKLVYACLYRFEMTFGLTKAYCDGFQTTKDGRDGWGEESVNTMVKHFPGGGMGEGGRDAHYAYGKYVMSIVIWVCSPKVSAKRIHRGSVAKSI